MTRHITIQGARFKVIESLGYQPSAGGYAAQVVTLSGPQMVFKPRGGGWRFWTGEDRTRPLVKPDPSA